MHPIFIGYTSLEDLEKELSLPDPVCVCLFSEGSGNGLTSIESIYIQVAQAANENCEVHYVRILVAEVQRLGGEIVPDHAVRYDHARQARQVIEDWLRSRGPYKVRDAAIAHPREVQFLVGTAECLAYNKETGWQLRT